MQKVWDWFIQRADTKNARFWLALLAFSESSFFIIPPDILLIAMLSARAGRWVYLSILTTVFSILGAMVGYLIGAFIFVPVADPIISFYGLSEEFAYVGQLYANGTFWLVFTAAFTPIPFKVFVLSGGFFNVPFIPFITASILGRGARFFMVAGIAHFFGPTVAERFIKDFKYITFIFVVLLAVFVAVWFDVPEWFF